MRLPLRQPTNPITSNRQLCASEHNRLLDFRLGSKADVGLALVDVRFTPKSRHSSALVQCPLSAKSRHSALRQRMTLFDHLVGAGKQRLRHGEPERPAITLHVRYVPNCDLD